MIDTHCHLNDDSYNEDLEQVISSAHENGVTNIIVPATNPKDFDRTVQIAENHQHVYGAIGVHPHNANDVNNDVLGRIRDIAKHNKICAIGEIGLDYYYNYAPKDIQINAFKEQLNIATDFNLPVMLHNRESDNDMLSILQKFMSNKKLEGVLHCFSSDINMLQKVLELNLFVSFTANITFAKTNLDEIVMQTPLNKILLETDSPYMTPPPNRGKRNVPQTVKIVAEKISNLKNISIDEVIKMTNENTKKLFRISLLFIMLAVGTISLKPETAYAYQHNDKNNFYDGNYLDNENNIEQQDEKNNEQDLYYDDETEYEDKYVRRLGFGPLLGTNTFVDRYTTGAKSFSYEGLFSYGGLINFRVFDNIILQAAYTYAYNDKFVNRLPDSVKHWLDPNYHHAIELNLIGMLNSERMVNFYGSVGGTYFINKLSKNFNNHKFYTDDNKLGINAGIGAFVNIDLGEGGTLTFNAEWKLSFRVDITKLDYDPRISPTLETYRTPTEYTSMSSVPRGGIIWYMPFLK